MVSLLQVVVVEFGSQYTPLIERTLRELNVRAVILDPKRAVNWMENNPVKAVILSGGASSVYDQDAPKLPEKVLSLRRPDGQPIAILGICYGMQWLAHSLGGEVKAIPMHKEYGEASIDLGRVSETFFEGTPNRQTVWMSHGDSVAKLPRGFIVLAKSHTGAIAAMRRGSVVGVQFHPEVTHTSHGETMLANFLHIAGCDQDWIPSSIVASIREETVAKLDSKKAIFGFSGGVDSTTVSAILAPVLGKHLLAVTIDGGQLRKGELKEIHNHAEVAGVTLRVIDAKEEFMSAMAGVVDAEEKRRRFKEIYRKLLVRAAQDFGALAVLQGTLAPDRIESGATGGATIKSHHNVGLAMDNLHQIHPVDRLFKDEIRALAKEMGLPESVWNRQPFPGPGLLLRILGVPVTPDRLDLVRWADARVRDILVRRGIYNSVSQIVVAYAGGAKMVGVKGDSRVYGGAIVVRAVKTLDFMTAQGVHFSKQVEKEICSTLACHPEITQVGFYPIDKPPGTIEFE